jgi:hypothetical protein
MLSKRIWVLFPAPKRRKKKKKRLGASGRAPV